MDGPRTKILVGRRRPAAAGIGQTAGRGRPHRPHDGSGRGGAAAGAAGPRHSAGPLRAAAAAGDPGKGDAAHPIEQGNAAVGDAAGGFGAGTDPLRRSGFSVRAPGGGETGPAGL